MFGSSLLPKISTTSAELFLGHTEIAFVTQYKPGFVMITMAENMNCPTSFSENFLIQNFMNICPMV
jgi:hypothetical protein